MSEEILGIFPAFVQKGAGSRDTFGFKGQMCKMIFTNCRLIATEDKRTGGNRLFRPIPYYLSSQASTRDKLKMQEEFLGSAFQPGTSDVQIPYEDIKVVEIMKPRMDSWKLRVFKNNLDIPEYTFTVSPPGHENYIGDLEKFVKEVLPGKI